MRYLKEKLIRQKVEGGWLPAARGWGECEVSV